MFARLFNSLPTLCLLLSTGLFSITLIGGCPAAQRPTVPAQEDEDQAAQAPPTPPGDELNRPIEQPDLDDTTTSGPGETITTGPDEEGGTGDGDGEGTTGLVILSMESPFDPVAVRPGAVIDVQFEVVDPTGSLESGELLLAFDQEPNDTPDGQPDGDPVLSLPITISAGSNSVAFDTREAEVYLINGFGRFVLGIRATTVDDEVTTAYSPATVTIDAVKPTVSWVSPDGDHLVNRNTFWTVQVHTNDTSPHTVRILLDPDEPNPNEPNRPPNANEFELVPETTFGVGPGTRTFDRIPLSAYPAGTYYYYVIVSDGIDPPVTFYAENPSTTKFPRLAVTNRLIGEFNLRDLAKPGGDDNGGILQGFNFNDLAGSSLASVPDLSGDNRDELIIGSRFGKAYIIEHEGVGFGEAYMIYGAASRLRGIQRLNSVGHTIPGLIFPGIRTPRTAGIAPPNESTRWTKGLSDITVVPDMDGDDLAEIVFSFPRVESINIGESDPSIQHPELAPDLLGMGNLEYNAFYLDGMFVFWHPNEAQFTRGGVVIVSSHNEMLRNPNRFNRKSDRVFDLHETGQLFNGMSRPYLVPYIRQALTRFAVYGEPTVICADCDGLPPDGCDPGDPGDPNDPNDNTPGDCGDDGCNLNMTSLEDGREQEVVRWIVRWDVVLHNQGPGGFHQSWTIPPADPPLANPTAFPFSPLYPFPFSFYPNHWVFMGDACFIADGCEVTNEWYSWFPTLPCTALGGTPSWATAGNPVQDPPTCYPDNPCVTLVEPEEGPCPEKEPNCVDPDITVWAGGASAWTGFYGPSSVPRVTVATGESFPTPVGARILGQKVDDEFGTTVASDGTWLYISAPERTANDAPYTTDVPGLPGSRIDSGIVYQLRTNAPTDPGGPTRTQLWIEPGQTWPNADAEDPSRSDYTMPVPHQYIIESIGSLRGDPEIGIHETALETADCPPPYDPGIDQPDPDACYAYTPYPVGTAGYYADRTPQIVGPHDGARISFVRALGDVNGDGVRDFAVGSADVQQTVVTPDPNGPPDVTFTGPPVGSIFIVYGRPSGNEGDYLLEQLALDQSDPERLNGVLLQGASSGETLARVFADAGDVNGDGHADVIVGNEGANGNTGEAIVLLGSATLLSPAGGWTAGTIPPGRAIRFVGAATGDDTGANVAGAGDVDGDGFSDILIAAPGDDGNRGAVYLVYGSDDLASLPQPISLSKIGTVDLPGVKFIGRDANDFLGGGTKTIPDTDPGGSSTTAFSSGVQRLGDIDGDGNADFAIGAMLADPGGRTDAGEVYILYGQAGP